MKVERATEITDLAYSPDGQRLASVDQDGMITVRDARTGTSPPTLQKHNFSVDCVAYSPDGRLLASGSRDKVVKVWDACTGVELLTLQGHTSGISSVAFSPDGKRLATVAGAVKVWDARTGAEIPEFKGGNLPTSCVEYSPDGQQLASASDGGIKLLDVRTGAEMLTLAEGAGGTTLAFSPDGGRLASGWHNGTVRVCDVRSGTELLSLGGLTGPVNSVVYSLDGSQLASGGKDGTIKVWDAHTGAELCTVTGKGGARGSLAFSADGQRLASARTGTITILDPRTGGELLSLEGHDSAQSLRFSPDGQRLASGGADGTIKVWDGRISNELSTLSHPELGLLLGVAFSRDGQRVMAMDHSKRQVAWDVKTGRFIPDVRVDVKLSRMATSPDGKYVAVINGSTVRLLGLPKPDEWELGYREWVTRTDPFWHREEGYKDDQAERWFAAAFHYRQAAADIRSDGRLYGRLGWAEAQLGRWSAAMDSYIRALALEPVAVFWIPDTTAYERSLPAVEFGRWKQAASDSLRAVRNAPDDFRRWKLLLFSELGLRQYDAYRSCCSCLLDRFDLPDGLFARDVAYLCALTPDALEDPARAVKLAERAVAKSPGFDDALRALGATLYRAGSYEKAINTLEEAMRLRSKFPGGKTVQEWFFLAMAHHRLRHTEEARRWLDKANTFLDKEKPANWQERIEWQVLREEAEAVILAKKP
jgi:WD40 repeat protein/tetratricopeptide (TPR) repeat protein